MTDEEKRGLAAQLRKPSGEIGLQVAEFMNKGNELLNRNTINQLDLKAGNTVLEIGMGNGKFIPELMAKASNLSYVGCDFSSLMVEEASANNKDLVENGQAQFYCTNANDLPLSADSIDAIFTVNTLYFWDDQTAILKEFTRVLKTGGKLVIGIRPKELMQHYAFVQYGFDMYHPDEVIDLLESNGFDQPTYTLMDEPDFVADKETFKVESLVVTGLVR